MKHVFLIAIVVAVIAAPAKGADTAAQLRVCTQNGFASQELF